MNITAIVDIVCAVFLCTFAIRILSRKDEQKNKWELIYCLLSAVMLVNDALAYTLTGPEYSAGLRFVLNFLSIHGVGLIILVYIFYTESLIKEKTKPDARLFCTLKIAVLIWLAASVFESLSKHMISFTDGIINLDYCFPAYIDIVELILLFAVPVYAVMIRKKIGARLATLFSIFAFGPILATVLFAFADTDLSYPLGAFTFLLMDLLIQEQLAREDKEKLSNAYARIGYQQEDLQEAVARNDALYRMIGGYKWTYGISADGEVISANYDEGAVRINDADNPENAMVWVDALHPDDRERVRAEFMAAVRDKSGNTPYETVYRILSKDGTYIWARTTGRLIPHADGTAELFGMSIDITDEIEAQQKNLLGAVPISPDILAKENIGMWAFELDEGQPPRMYGDDAMIKLVGLDHQVPPDEMYHAWYDHIDEASYKLVQDAVDKMMSGEHAEVQYPWHHPDGHTMIVRCGGVRNPEYTKGIRVEGTHQNVTEVLHYDEEEIQRQKQADSVKKMMNMLFSLSSEYDPIIVVEPESGEYDWYMSQVDELTVNTSMTMHGDSLYKNIGIDGSSIIHPDDRARFQAFYTRENMCKIAETGEAQETENRWFLKLEGRYKWKYNKAVRMVDDEGKVYVVVGVIDTTEAKEKEASQITNAVLSEYFLKSYASAYYVDLNNNSLEVLRVLKGFDESLAGKTLPANELLTGYMGQNAHPDDRERVMQNLDIDFVREKLKTVDEFSFIYRDISEQAPGTYRCTIIPGYDKEHVAIGFQDITAELRQQNEQQKQTEKNLQLISGLASGYNALYYINIDENILNIIALDEEKYPGSRAIFEGEEADFYKVIGGYGLSEQVHPDDRHLFENFSAEWFREKLKNRKKYSMRFRAATADGYRWDEMELIKYEDADEQANVVAVGFTDRDADIRREQEYQQMLKDARYTAEEANRSKTDFLFNMSHDIRTPMNAITGFTNMAIKHIDDKEKVLDCLDKTQRAGNMLLSLINSVLEVSRIESGNATLDEQPGDVYYSFHNIEHTMRELADTKDIDITFEYGDIRDRFVYADFSRSMRIFVNVISNAIKYTPEGGRVKVRCEQIGAAKDGYGHYRYTVADNGIGMSEEFLEHIFDKFSREETSTVSGIQGTGLGMPVVKAFAELMGGDVSVESEQGKGTTVIVDLPFRLQEDESYTDPETGEVIPRNGKSKPAEQYDFSGKRVLLVEDNELNREIAIDILGEAGFMVEDADDGTTAVERLKEKGPGYYDFILMDIQMPKMNGYEATKEIRKMYPDRHIPIIALSANAFAEDKKKSLESGMDDHVAKPININELFGALAKFM